MSIIVIIIIVAVIVMMIMIKHFNDHHCYLGQLVNYADQEGCHCQHHCQIHLIKKEFYVDLTIRTMVKRIT